MGGVQGRGLRPVDFRGDSLDALKEFPLLARKEAGHELDRVQHGEDPNDWKPMSDVGPGVREIRIRDSQGIFRVMYVTKFDDVVYVLHCFQKKTQKTSKSDLQLGKERYAELVRERMR
jgi:phage-related protein